MKGEKQDQEGHFEPGPRCCPVFAGLDAGIDPGLFKEWAWLLPTPMRPLVVNLFGDTFFRDDRDGSLHFLDVLAGELYAVGGDADRLEHMLTDSGFREVFLRTDLLAALAARGKPLGEGEIFSPRRPLSRGGTLDPDNFEACPIAASPSFGVQTGQATPKRRAEPTSPAGFWGRFQAFFHMGRLRT